MNLSPEEYRQLKRSLDQMRRGAMQMAKACENLTAWLNMCYNVDSDLEENLEINQRSMDIAGLA